MDPRVLCAEAKEKKNEHFRPTRKAFDYQFPVTHGPSSAGGVGRTGGWAVLAGERLGGAGLIHILL